MAERREGGDWHVNQWAKKAVLLGFRIKDMERHEGGPQGGGWWDKVDSKFAGWGENQWRAAGFRAVPNCVVRRSAFIARGVVLIPSFVNLGAYVDEGTMVRLRSTSDAHLRLRLEEAGDKLIKMLEVAKVRGAAKSTGNIIGFNVEPGIGMRMIAVAKAKA